MYFVQLRIAPQNPKTPRDQVYNLNLKKFLICKLNRLQQRQGNLTLLNQSCVFLRIANMAFNFII